MNGGMNPAFTKTAYARAEKSYTGNSEFARSALRGDRITSISHIGGNKMTTKDKYELNKLAKQGKLWAVKGPRLTYWVRPGTSVNASFW